jgi:hypothetical protein
MLQIVKYILSIRVHALVPLFAFVFVISGIVFGSYSGSSQSTTATPASPASSATVKTDKQVAQTSDQTKPAETQPTSTATTQTTTPTTQQKPAATKPAPIPMSVTSLSLTGSITCQYDPDSMYVIAHAVSHVASASFNSNHAGGLITWKWEIQGDYADMDGYTGGAFSQSIYAATRTLTLSAFGDGPSLDMEGPSDGMRFRAVVLSPNPIVSNWIESSSCN